MQKKTPKGHERNLVKVMQHDVKRAQVYFNLQVEAWMETPLP